MPPEVDDQVVVLSPDGVLEQGDQVYFIQRLLHHRKMKLN
jgi:phage baseplate assembly protein gpV